MNLINSSDLKFDDIANGIQNDLHSWRKDLNQFDLNKYSLNLKQANFASGVLLFFYDWSVIILTFFVCLNKPFLLPIGLIFAGSKQRGLSNLIHDASHWNLLRNKKWNDLATDLLAGFAMISPIQSYRRTHILHHRYLGHPYLDPDLKMHQRYGYDDNSPPYHEWYKNIQYLIFNLSSLKDSFVGSWFEISFTQKVKCLLWWIGFMTLFSLISTQKALLFFLFWNLSRSTGYHLVRTIAEFLDHSGLPTGSIAKNCRFISADEFVFRNIFHPHNDRFHALHHFEPKIPCYNLEKAHSCFKDKITSYASVKKNEGYFFGAKSALKDLEGT